MFVSLPLAPGVMLGRDRDDLAWSALPDAPTVDGAPTGQSTATHLRRLARRLLSEQDTCAAICARPALD